LLLKGNDDVPSNGSYLTEQFPSKSKTKAAVSDVLAPISVTRLSTFSLVAIHPGIVLSSLSS
jgi:hypothetical protein